MLLEKSWQSMKEQKLGNHPSEYLEGLEMKRSILAVCTLLICQSVLAQPPTAKPKELTAIRHWVGDWTSDVTSKPSVWNPNETKLRTSNHAEMMLDGWFLQHIEVNHVVDDPKKITKAIWFSKYDSEAKEYVSWFFQSSGLIGKSTGTWSEETQTFAFTPTELPPNTSGKHMETFKTKDFIEGDYVIKSNDGRTMFDMEWTRTRQKGLVPNPLRKQWAEIGTPIQPVPDEVKKLEAFLGEWDAEFVNRPSVVSPNGGTSNGTMTGHWILDGRFLYGTTKVGKHESIWIAGYDPNEKAYRYIRMTNAGLIDEAAWSMG